MLKYTSSSRDCAYFKVAETLEFVNRIRTVMKWRRPSRLKIWSLAWQLKETWQDIWWMSREVCWFQNCHFDLQGLLGEEERLLCRMSVWCSEKRNKNLGKSSRAACRAVGEWRRCHHPSQSRWVIENDWDFYTDQSAWEWSWTSYRGVGKSTTLETLLVLLLQHCIWCLGIW